MAQRSVPAPFLTKTYLLVDDESSDDVISWSESGTTFVVWKTADFANDLLPKYFKHNNFSSFVRQLNTYGFRKIVPDKWEFANDNFKRGEKELLIKIRRRKAATSAPTQSKNAGKAAGNDHFSQSNSGEDGGSTSNSSPDSKNPGSIETAPVTQVAELSEENEKLKKDNEILNWELAETKKQCDDLVGCLTEYLKVGPDQINRIMRQGSRGSAKDVENDEAGKDIADKDGESLKLFGVWLSKTAEKKTKRLRDDKGGLCEPHAKSLKSVALHALPGSNAA